MRRVFVLIVCCNAGLMTAAASLEGALRPELTPELMKRVALQDTLLLEQSTELHRRSGRLPRSTSPKASRSHTPSFSRSEQSQTHLRPMQDGSQSRNPVIAKKGQRSESNLRIQHPFTGEIIPVRARSEHPRNFQMEEQNSTGRPMSPQRPEGNLNIQHPFTGEIIPVEVRSRYPRDFKVEGQSSVTRLMSRAHNPERPQTPPRPPSPARSQAPSQPASRAMGNPAMARVEARGPARLDRKQSTYNYASSTVEPGHGGFAESRANPASVYGFAHGRGSPRAAQQTPEEHPLRLKAEGDMVSGWVAPPPGGRGHVKITTPEGTSASWVPGGRLHQFAAGSHLPGGTSVIASSSRAPSRDGLASISVDAISFPIPIPHTETSGEQKTPSRDTSQNLGASGRAESAGQRPIS